MIDHLQSKNRTNLTGQLDMFSVGQVERPNVEYPSLSEYKMADLLAQEKEAAGMYFSGHMLDGFSKALSDPSIKSIKDLQATDDSGEYLFADRTPVTVAGIVTALTRKTTKKEEQMAFFTVEDRYGEMECLAFPKIYARIAHELRVDSVILLRGELSIREEERPKLLVSALEPLIDDHAPPRVMQETELRRDPRPQEKPRTGTPLPKLPPNPKILYLRVPSTAQSDPKWKRVKVVLDIFDGDLPVSVYDASTASYQKMEIGFDLSPFTLQELISILGKENVVLK
jgi:DNA polymerase-3 subunit alpha